MIARINRLILLNKILRIIAAATTEIKNRRITRIYDIGVPVIVFESENGTKQGYFGPVLNELPELEESLVIFDSLSKLATVKSFYELKRTRPAGDPDVYSTARC